jgi:hypothetical protein
MTVSLALDGNDLGTICGRKLTLSMLADAGFGRVDVKHVEGDILNNYHIAYPKCVKGCRRCTGGSCSSSGLRRCSRGP